MVVNASSWSILMTQELFLCRVIIAQNIWSIESFPLNFTTLTIYITAMQNDQLWKSILEDIFEDFLTFFYPETEQMFDFARGFIEIQI